MQWVALNHRPPDLEFEVLTAQPHISRIGSNGFLRVRALTIVISKDAGKQSPLISVLLGICYDRC